MFIVYGVLQGIYIELITRYLCLCIAFIQLRDALLADNVELYPLELDFKKQENSPMLKTVLQNMS